MVAAQRDGGETGVEDQSGDRDLCDVVKGQVELLV